MTHSGDAFEHRTGDVLGGAASGLERYERVFQAMQHQGGGVDLRQQRHARPRGQDRGELSFDASGRRCVAPEIVFKPRSQLFAWCRVAWAGDQLPKLQVMVDLALQGGLAHRVEQQLAHVGTGVGQASITGAGHDRGQ
ncbi:hypothetical protein D3C84_974320 [compost metagenome]